MTHFNGRYGREAVETRRATTSRWGSALPAVVATVLWATSPGAATQEAPDVTVLEPCRESCGITLVPDREYGDDSGDGMIEMSVARSWRDASGRLTWLACRPTMFWCSVPTGASLDESVAKELAPESSSSWAPSC